MIIFHCGLLCATECVLFTVHTTNLAYDFQPDKGEMYKLSLKILIKTLHKKVLDRFFPNLKQSFTSSRLESVQAYITSYSHAMLMLFLGSCNPLFYLPNLAKLSCTPPFFNDKNTVPTSFKHLTGGQALCNGCWTTSGQPLCLAPFVEHL